jgi:DedD protein
MDESLKARLIGAAVLVALAVVLIPELLTGRKAPESGDDDASMRGNRTVTIELGEPTGTAAPADDAVDGGPLEPARAPDVRQAAAPPQEAPRQAVAAPVEAPADQTAKTAGEPRAAPAAPAPEALSAPSPAAPTAGPASPRGGYVIQVGAFGSLASARKLVADLIKDGYKAFVAPAVKRSGKTLHPVQVGPEPDRASADRLAKRLKARGLPTAIVANH